MLDAERYATAASLAALSIEESGKVPILRDLSLAKSQDELKKHWKRYRCHRDKNAMWILPELFANGARTLYEFKKAFDPFSDHTDILNAVKQIGFYSDCYGVRHWSMPSNVIDHKLAKYLVEISKIFSSKCEVTPREIELWVEILGPSWNTPERESAFFKWHEAMIAEGFAIHSKEEFRNFILGFSNCATD